MFDSTFRSDPLPVAFKRAVLGRVLGASFPWHQMSVALGPERSEELHGPVRPLSKAEEVLLGTLWHGADPSTLAPLRLAFGARLEHVAALLAFARHATCLLASDPHPAVNA